MYKSRINMIVKVGVFAAIAFILQILGGVIPKVSGFLEVEFSDLPAIIISFAMGPLAGVLVELIKNLLHSFMTTTGFVGEFANFIVNGCFVFTCGYIYKKNKTKGGAIISLTLATVVLVIAGIFVNFYVMIPLYMPQASVIEKLKLVLFTIAPFNFVRGSVLSVITILIYKRISGLIK